MWPGPYGNWGSRKYLMASLDQSLRRMHLDYVDIFYIHRYDPVTPLEETLRALVDIVRSGKALYVGISRWPADALRIGLDYLRAHECPCLLYQDRLNMLDTECIANGRIAEVEEHKTGFIAFSPLAQGLLTDRYISGEIPEDSRAARNSHLTASQITPELVERLRALNAIAVDRGQTLAQMALAWILAKEVTTSVIVGASSERQLASNLSALSNLSFSQTELEAIASIVSA